jgi:hypothetical protein
MEATSDDKQVLSTKVLRIFIRPGWGMYWAISGWCGALKISSRFMPCCAGFQQNSAGHLPDPMSVDIRQPIEEFTANRKPNLPRSLNRDLRSVIPNAQIASRNAGASALFLMDAPYAVDSYR